MAEWKNAPLYQALLNYLPAFVTTSESEPTVRNLNVQKLRRALNPVRTHEGVYKWFRAGQLQARNAKAICDLAAQPENLALLKAARRKPPTMTDMLPFISLD